MADDAPDSPQTMTRDALVAEILHLRVQEQDLAAQLADLEAQRQALEALLVARLRDLLGPDLAAQVAAALLPPISRLPTEPESRGLTPAPPPPSPAPPRLEVRGVNYYPSQHGWARMWTEWTPDEIRNELHRAQSLGANTVRTFLPYSILEEGQYDPQQILDRVDQFLAMATMFGMRTILGLFDEADRLRNGLVDNIPAAVAHVNRVLNYHSPRTEVRLGEDPRILMWDLVNELDDYWNKSLPRPDDPDRNHLRPLFIQPVDSGDPAQKFYPTKEGDPLWPFTANGLAWLRSVYTAVSQGSTQEITLSVLNPSSMIPLLREFRDARYVPQYHEYLPFQGDWDAYRAKIADNMHIVSANPLGSGRRVLIGEVGTPSRMPDPHNPGKEWSEDVQSRVIQTVLDAAAANASLVRGVLVWTLMDFNYPDSPVDDPERYRGLYKADGTPKAAAVTVAARFAAA
jgi:hypothetical protein